MHRLTFFFFLVFSVSAVAQQCSAGSFTLTQDDKKQSASCSISVLSGDIVSVTETQAYNLSCNTTQGNAAPNTNYFTTSVSASGNGQLFCGEIIGASAFDCSPVFSMRETQATSTADFNRFFFDETDRDVNAPFGRCDNLVAQEIFRQCAGQPCNAPTKPGQPCDNDPTAPGGGGDKPDVINGCSPIVIDLTGNGFELTSAANGVKFDIANTGTPIQIAWTANSNNGWLVLDRDGNGIITSGAEMFGNFTSQPSSPSPNGFLALAVYDDPANGGNGDGIIDSHDQIFSKLRLWVDANHDGICQPGELHTLPEMGVFALGLDYSLSGHTDQFGNAFHYSASVDPGLSGKDDNVGRKAYDVFLTTH